MGKKIIQSDEEYVEEYEEPLDFVAKDSTLLTEAQQKEIFDYLKTYFRDVQIFGHDTNRNPDEFEYGVGSGLNDFVFSDSFLLGLLYRIHNMRYTFVLHFCDNVDGVLITIIK